jgi:hypothetical protein
VLRQCLHDEDDDDDDDDREEYSAKVQHCKLVD